MGLRSCILNRLPGDALLPACGHTVSSKGLRDLPVLRLLSGRLLACGLDLPLCSGHGVTTHPSLSGDFPVLPMKVP